MPGANEKAPYVLDLADLQAVKRLDAVITRCYEVTKPEETKPLLWRILYNCVLRLWQNQSTVRITTLCWDLDQEFSIISGQPIVFENRPSSDSKYRVTAGVLRDVLDKIRFTSPEDGEKVRLIFFQALGFEVDNPLLRKLAGLPLHQEECEQASNNRNKMGDALPVPRTSQTPQNQSQEVVSKRQIDGEPSARRKWPRRGLEATAKSHRSAMLNESHSPTQPTQPTQPLEEPPNSARDGLLASDNQHDNTQSGVGSQGGSPREADHDIEQCRLTRQGYEERLAAMQAEIEELRRSDNHLLQCGLAWRKERDQLRDRLARST